MSPRSLSSTLVDNRAGPMVYLHPTKSLLVELVSTELNHTRHFSSSTALVTSPVRSRGESGCVRSCEPCCEPASFPCFPPASMKLLLSIPGNGNCIDCGSPDPQWAAVSYGALVCLQCSGRHRSLGVQVSVVRSLAMDSWTRSQVLAMLEGGNKQLGDFFCRHQLCQNSADHSKWTPSCHTRKNDSAARAEDLALIRYKTNAALFYRSNLTKHVARVGAAEKYLGREASRQHREVSSSSET